MLDILTLPWILYCIHLALYKVIYDMISLPWHTLIPITNAASTKNHVVDGSLGRPAEKTDIWPGGGEVIVADAGPVASLATRVSRDVEISVG